MKVKKFKIKIQSHQKSNRDFIDRWEATSRRTRHVEDDYDLVLSLPDLSHLARVFSPERIRLIQAVRDLKPESVSRLAELLGRAQPNVQRDVQDLAELGILVLEKVKKEGKKSEVVQPRFEWDGFDVAV